MNSIVTRHVIFEKDMSRRLYSWDETTIRKLATHSKNVLYFEKRGCLKGLKAIIDNYPIVICCFEIMDLVPHDNKIGHRYLPSTLIFCVNSLYKTENNLRIHISDNFFKKNLFF